MKVPMYEPTGRTALKIITSKFIRCINAQAALRYCLSGCTAWKWTECDFFSSFPHYSSM